MEGVARHRGGSGVLRRGLRQGLNGFVRACLGRMEGGVIGKTSEHRSAMRRAEDKQAERPSKVGPLPSTAFDGDSPSWSTVFMLIGRL